MYYFYSFFQEFLEASLSAQILEALFVRIMEIIVGTSISNGGGARNHDVLAAFMTIMITPKTVKLVLPSCLRTNEQIRLYALSTVLRNLNGTFEDGVNLLLQDGILSTFGTGA